MYLNCDGSDTFGISILNFNYKLIIDAQELNKTQPDEKGLITLSRSCPSKNSKFKNF